MNHDERLKRWLKAKKRLRLKCRQIAALMDITPQTCFNWNCGAQTIPEERVKQLEAMK